MSVPISNSMQDTDRQSSNDRKHYLGVLGLDGAAEAVFKEKILALAEVYLDMYKPVSQQIEDWELYMQQVCAHFGDDLGEHKTGQPVRRYVARLLSRRYRRRSSARKGSQSAETAAAKTDSGRRSGKQRTKKHRDARYEPVKVVNRAYVLIPAIVPPEERRDDSVRFFLSSLNPDLSHLAPFLEATGVKSGTELRAMGTWRFERIHQFIDCIREQHPEVTQFAANIITQEIASLGAPRRPTPTDTF